MSSVAADSESSPHKRLAGKVAIITGGASGIGASSVRLFHQHGAKVVIADIQDNLGQAIADNLGDDVCYIHCDVSNEEQVTNLVNAAVSKFGKLDIMYNNAGVVDRAYASILESTKADLDLVIGVNLVGSFLVAKHAARVMVPQQSGTILFTASAATEIAGLSTHSYAASKYAVLGLSKNVAAELGRYGIRVNCVSPYGLVSGMLKDVEESQVPQVESMLSAVGNLKGQILRADDVARAALFLASDEASYVSGLNLVVDGGFSIVNPTMAKTFGYWKE